MKTELIGKTIESAAVIKKNNNLFMSDEKIKKYSLLKDGTVANIFCLNGELYIELDNGYGLLFLQSGGKILFNKSELPKNYNIIFKFTDGCSLTYTMMLFTLGILAVSHEEWQNRLKNSVKFDPFDEKSFDDYMNFINSKDDETMKKPIKTFLATDISGIMSTFAAEILLYAKIYPSLQLKKLSKEQHENIFESIKSVLKNACEKCGRTSEYNLYGQKGNYIAMAERKHIGESCPVCKTDLAKISVGGVTAFCPNCQKK